MVGDRSGIRRSDSRAGKRRRVGEVCDPAPQEPACAANRAVSAGGREHEHASGNIDCRGDGATGATVIAVTAWLTPGLRFFLIVTDRAARSAVIAPTLLATPEPAQRRAG